MLAAVLAFSAMDAAAKWLTQGYSVVEVAVLSRLDLAVPGACHRRAAGWARTLKTRHPVWHLARAGANGVTLLTFFAALIFLPLGRYGRHHLRQPADHVRARRADAQRTRRPAALAAIVIGFLGVLVITQPSGAGFGWGAVLALSAAFATRPASTSRGA